MKKIYLAIIFFLITCASFAAGEEVWVVTNSITGAYAKTASELGPINPCTASLPFYVDVHIPAGYAIVGKFEWFVNGISVKTTTDPSDPILLWTIVAKPTNVYCKVTYKKTDGTLSSPFQSTTFIPIIKDLNFQSITTSTPSPNYGCTTNTVSYSLSTYTCTSFCDYTYTVGSYSITWAPPSGWTQTSISTNGNDVSFTPDASSAGTLTATIHLPCGYTETKTFTITRVAETPTFTTPNVTSCTSSAAVSINSTCGASDYTYTIVGNSGITFTSNGLQTLTSSSTTVNITIAGSGSSVNTIKAKANYPNSISSSEASSTLTVGVPYVYSTYNYNGSQNPIHLWSTSDQYYNPACNLTSTTITTDIQGATSFTWSKVTSTPSNITWTTNNGNNLDYYFWNVGQTAVFQIDATNTCGTTTQAYGFQSFTCGNDNGGGCARFSVSPNPAHSTLSILSRGPDIPQYCYRVAGYGKNNDDVIQGVRIYDKVGNLKIFRIFMRKTKQADINVSGLKTGVYFIDIYNGKTTERQQIIIAN